MASIDPRMLLQAAMQQGNATGAPPDAAGAAGTAPDALPAASPGAGPPGASPAPTGAPNTGGMSNTDLASVLGSGSELGQQPDATAQMVQLLQDPSTPPDQRAEIQMRLQLAALRSLAGGPTGAAGASS